MQPDITKVLIIGGGLSGLSLAYWLSCKNPEIQITILESRKEYRQDKHWGFWNKKNTDEHLMPFQEIICSSFDSWKVGGSISESSIYNYSIIKSLDFYNFVKNKINGEIILDCPFTENLSTKEFDLIFDSRNPQNIESEILQQFYGWEIELSQDNIDFTTLALMDFGCEELDSAITFYYLVPLTNKKILIEPTAFTKKKIDKEWFQMQFDKFIKKNNILDFNIVNEESGILPMDYKFYNVKSEYYPLGIRSGWLRASSGYCFERTQYFSYLISHDVSKFNYSKDSKPTLPKQEYSFLVKQLDRIFLNVLKTNINLTPEIIENWFEELDSDRLVKFLAGLPSNSDLLNLISKTKHKSLFLKNIL